MTAAKAFSALLVDDDPHMHLMFELVAEHDRFALCTAESALEAISCLETFHPDVVIIDLFMPEIDGYQTLSMLRKSSLNDHCRFVATTSYHTSNMEKEVMACGFDAYLKKPLHLPSLGISLMELIST